MATSFKGMTLLFSVFLCLTAITATAKDISNEQRNAYEARETFHKKKSAHDNLLKRIVQQEKRLEEEQARLNQLRTDEQSAKTELDQAKTNLDEKVDALNAVWGSRNQK